MKLNGIFTFEWDHNDDSYGVVIKSDEWKIWYTGDTAPTNTLINYWKNPTLLIH